MPIALKCECGKQLKVRDELAGKAIKCPACQQPVRVPAAGKAVPAQPATRTRPAPAPAPTAGGDLDSLFAEEGMDQVVAQACPACGVPMAANAVLCTKCGYNIQTGERLEGHKVAGVDIDMGTMALDKAASDIEKDKELQEKMLGKSGMPPWMLALVLSIMAGAVGIATLTVNASRRAESIGFSPMATFLNFAGALFLVVAIGSLLSLMGAAFKKSRNQGLLTLTILYAPIFGLINIKTCWKPLLVLLVCGGAGGGLLAAASNY
ncbi:MAG: hypothetical protein AAGD07_25385 [Planctomycetota bacterium]